MHLQIMQFDHFLNVALLVLKDCYFQWLDQLQ
jgi:hypothetical protein